MSYITHEFYLVTPMSSDYEKIRASMQENLYGFLLAEIQSGMTAARSARLVRQLGRTDHVIETKHRVLKTAETVRKFLGQIRDGETRAALADQLTELERIIQTSEVSLDPRADER